jgi:hypothetical protein
VAGLLLTAVVGCLHRSAERGLDGGIVDGGVLDGGIPDAGHRHIHRDAGLVAAGPDAGYFCPGVIGLPGPPLLEMELAAGWGAVADFDGDGIPDLVSGGAGLEVHLGIGNGRFGPAILTSLNENVIDRALVVGDFNGDGKPDVAWLSALHIHIVLGAARGTFGPERTINLAAKAIATADFNRDGKLDLIVASGQVATVFLGNGDGTFTFVATTATSTSGLAVGDFNGDGLPDLATSGELYLGRGDGTFGPALPYPSAGPNPPTPGWKLAAGDVNGDGSLDLVEPGGSQPGVLVFLGLGNGNFRAAAASPIYTGEAFTVADLDRDGRADLITSSLETLNVRLGRADGTFGSRRDYPGAQYGGALLVSDVDRDGHPDVVALSSYGTASILLGNGDGTFLAEERIHVEAGPERLAAGDFNGDGLSDLAVTLPAWIAPSLVELSNGDGGFRKDLARPLGTIPRAFATADFDGDGHNDLAVTDGTNATVEIRMGQRDGGYRAAVSYLTPEPPGEILVGDLNDDGVPDLLISGFRGWTWLAGVGDGGFLPSAVTALPAISGALGDTNRDDTLDFVDRNGAVYLGNGDGTFAPALPGPTYALYPSVLVDTNFDGNPDLVSIPFHVSEVWVLMGKGDGTFSPPTVYPTDNHGRSNSPYALVVADFNGDGKVDVVFASRLRLVGLLLGKGDGSFGPVTNYPSLNDSNLIFGASGDFNGDGRPDLAVSTSVVEVMLNRGCY